MTTAFTITQAVALVTFGFCCGGLLMAWLQRQQIQRSEAMRDAAAARMHEAEVLTARAEHAQRLYERYLRMEEAARNAQSPPPVTAINGAVAVTTDDDAA